MLRFSLVNLKQRFVRFILSGGSCMYNAYKYNFFNYIKSLRPGTICPYLCMVRAKDIKQLKNSDYCMIYVSTKFSPAPPTLTFKILARAWSERYLRHSVINWQTDLIKVSVHSIFFIYSLVALDEKTLNFPGKIIFGLPLSSSQKSFLRNKFWNCFVFKCTTGHF